MITQDNPESNPLIDWDIIERCTIGFDADSMPAGEDPTKNFKDHVLGTYDNQPKDPQWASAITGISPEKIEELANILGKQNKVAMLSSWGPARGNNSDNLPQIFMIVGAMGGHFGQSGHMMSCSLRDTGVNGGSLIIIPGMRGLPYVQNAVDDCIGDATLWSSILNKKYNFTGIEQFLEGEEREIDIKCLYNYSINISHRHEGQKQGIEAMRNMELIVTHALAFNSNVRYSDIVLPVITPWEKVPALAMFTGREAVYFGDKIIEPLFEGKNDQYIGRELLKRWGIDETICYPSDELGQAYNQISTAMIFSDTGEIGPLISFTAEELAEFGVDAEPREAGRLSYSEFKELGVYSVPRAEGDIFGHIAYKAFREDPDANPMASESGKMEFYCRRLNEYTKRMGYSEAPPVPTYMSPIGGYGDTFADYASGTKGSYPYQLFNPHYFRTAHAHFDNVPNLREAAVRLLYINSEDAKEKGINDGDTVHIFNENGESLRPACVTNRIVKGAVALPHGGWVEVDEKTGIDRGGSGNYLTKSTTTGLGTSGYNTQICNIEKWTGAPLVSDWERINTAPACQQG
jgi:anaerobic dimethyl sulfoxide reductase subunit A